MFVAGHSLERGGSLASPKASSAHRLQAGITEEPVSSVYGSMKVKFFKSVVHRGQDGAFTPLSASLRGLLPALEASTEQEPGFDESQP